MPRYHQVFAFVLSLFLCGHGDSLPAQRPGLKPTVFAIHNARIVVEPGKVLPKATVVIRDGVVEAVGADVAVPADALAIDGQGLTVYPGFIDALSNWGFDPSLRRSEGGAPAPVDLASEALAATRPDHRKGMTPEFLVASALRAEEEQADAWRKAGFTAHLIAPDGGTVVGQSALVSLSGAAPREAVVRPVVALHLAFQSTAGADYPRSLMGVVAHTRQTLLDAGHYQRSWIAFEKNSRIGRRPPTDSALAALGAALAGKQAVVFEADGRDSIHRALDFANEFQLRPIIYGGRDAAKVADRLKAMQVAVLLRINASEQQARSGRRPGGPGPAPTADAESKALPRRVEDDQKRRLEETLRQASELQRLGIRFAISTQGQAGDKPADRFRENLSKIVAAGLPADAALAALTTDAARILGVEKQLGTVAAGKAAHLVVMDGDFHEPKSQVRFVFADGVRFVYEGTPKPVKPEEPKKLDEPKKPSEAKPDSGPPAREQATELEADRVPRLKTGGNLLVRNATLLTVTRGNLARTDLLIHNGKIVRIAPNITPSEGVTVLDAEGMFVMPGIIDTHCHFAMSGGVNEFSLSVVPEVRVRDVIDGEDVQIFRSLAGGVTTARLLHGSANCIGGQDAVIKLKYGRSAKDLLLASAPRGVKFALGENVKRTDGRFPNTRLGVEAVLVRAFSEAQAYRKSWEDHERTRRDGSPLPEPRRDLRLEALVDVLKGDLKVHCHCYRADEILMLLRVADKFGFKVQSLQHVLEGYKIAPEIADHGASCSTFSDWWAYKIEAYDAIPFNSALLHQAGAVVCLKSDSNELIRHLYQEAAKCIKYGNMTEAEALKTITLNGAKQLGLEQRLGSLDVGKDADLAIFNGHPLDSYARVEMTVVEGEVYFQRSEKLTPAAITAKPPVSPAVFKGIPTNPQQSYVISNVKLHSVSGPAAAYGRVQVVGGKIAKVETSAQPFPAGEPLAGFTFIDGTGLSLYPGMIDAGTVLGLTELGSARETHDFAEGGDFQPDLRASSAVNPDSEMIPVTRANGVTTVVTRPIGSIVAGQGALINLAGWVPKEMAVVDPLALHVEFPAALPMNIGDPNTAFVFRAIARKEREEKIRRLKELFQQSLAYDEAKKADPRLLANPRLEALVPYARGQKPVIIQANRKPEIVEALKLAEDLKIKVILSGAIDAWKVTDDLKQRDIPVIVGPIMTIPQERYDPYDAPYGCPARLHQAGVRFCIRSGGSSNTRNLPYEAAMAVSYGLPAEEGLKAVTLYPAQILGVADQLGTIAVGKRANLVLTDGDLLQASTHVLALFIDGRPLEPTSKQTRLYERYSQRLKEVKEGKAPLGTR